MIKHHSPYYEYILSLFTVYYFFCVCFDIVTNVYQVIDCKFLFGYFLFVA